MGSKKYSMVITEDERTWLHKIARQEKKSISLMIIECFRKKSRILGIPLPGNRIPDNRRNYQEFGYVSQREISLKKILEEIPQLSFI